jgi:hypothetical protein
MGRFDNEQFHRLVEFLSRAGGVDKCLPYPDMTTVPPGFNEFASQDSQKQGYEWADVCPAYALALITAGGYSLPQDDSDMEILWDELGGNSTKLWPEVRGTIERSWSWLDAHHRPVDALH